MPCSSRRCRASLPQAVVLPEPWRPAIRITVGPGLAKRQVAARPAHQLGELLGDDLHHLLAGVERVEHLLAERALLHRRR